MTEIQPQTEVKLPPDKNEIFRIGREIVLGAPQLYVDVDV